MKQYDLNKTIQYLNGINIQAINLMEKKVNKEKFKCMCPNCTRKAIQSHSISKIWLQDFKKNGSLINIPPTPLINKFFIKNVSKKASVSQMFCYECDNKLFKIFESDKNGENNVFKKADMLLYRAICKKLFVSNKKKKTELLLKKIDQRITKNIYNIISEKNSNNNNNLYSNNEYNLLLHHKKKMDDYIKNNIENFNDYIHIFIEVKDIDFIFSEILLNETEKNINKCFIGFNYLKHNENGLDYIIISSHLENYNNLLQIIKQITEEKKENRILEYLLSKGNNIFLNNKIIKSSFNKALMLNIFYNDFTENKITNLYSINNKNKTNLIKNSFYSDNYHKITNIKINVENMFTNKNNIDFFQDLENTKYQIKDISHFIIDNDLKIKKPIKYEDINLNNINNYISYLSNSYKYERLSSFLIKFLEQNINNIDNKNNLGNLLKETVKFSILANNIENSIKTLNMILSLTNEKKINIEKPFIESCQYFLEQENNISIEELKNIEDIDKQAKVLKNYICQKQDNYKIFSLKKNNIPLYTIKIENETIKEILGKNNSIPNEKTIEYIEEILRENNIINANYKKTI